MNVIHFTNGVIPPPAAQFVKHDLYWDLKPRHNNVKK